MSEQEPEHDMAWLKARLAEDTTCPPEWQHVLEFHDALEVMKAQGVRPPALDRWLAAEKERMHKTLVGPAAIDPAETAWRGAVVGSVLWLVGKQGGLVEDARSFVSQASGVGRDKLRRWLHDEEKSRASTRNYKLHISIAAGKAGETLDDLLRRLHNQLGPDAAKISVQHFLSRG